MQQINKPYEGLFITIEGGEGCGKSTLSKALAEVLKKRGYSVHLTREPGGTPLSEKIRQLILHPEKGMKICDRAELLLFLAARAQHIEEVLLPELRAGHLVICERFHDSTIAYQGCARYLGVHDVESLCKLASGKLEADFTLLLDIDPKEGLKRVSEGRLGGLDRMEEEALQFHQEVRQGFLHLADHNPHRICIIDGSLSEAKVLECALKELEPRLMLKPIGS